MYAKLNEMYDSRVTAEIVGLGSSTAEHNTKTQGGQLSKARRVEDEYYGYYDGPQYSQDTVSAFQTSLWVAWGFVAAVIVAIVYLCVMDKLYDSILYKTTDGPRPIQNVK